VPAEPAASKTTPTPAPVPEPVAVSKTATAAGVGSTRVELLATEPSWVSIRAADGTTLLSGVIEPGKSQTVDIRQAALMRAGNAGGLTIRGYGKSLGPLGPHGAVRDVQFKNGDFKLVPVK
jgi:type II secretory pathway component PulM